MIRAEGLPGVIPWWTVNGRFVPGEAERQLDDLLGKGVTEFFLYPNFGLEEPDFLTEEWFGFVGFVIGACKKRGMRFWLYDELSWPSGTAGGRLCREHPEYRMRTLRKSSVTLAPGETWVPEPEAGYVLIEAVPGGVQDVHKTVREGFRNGTDGPVRLFTAEKVLNGDCFFSSMGTSGTRNDPGIMDALSPEAVSCWMAYNYIPYAERFPDELGKTVRGFFFDEPAMVSPFRTGDVPWTLGIEALFEKAYGYDMVPHLRAVFEQVPGEEQFRLDFWTLLAERFADSFAGRLSRWCDAHGLLLSGHCWPEEPSCQRLMTTATGSIRLLQKHLHVPGTDVLYADNCFAEKAGMCPGMPKWARNLIYSAKHPSSVARYSGMRYTICESSGITELGDAPSSPASQKVMFDFLCAMGISVMNPARPYDMTDFRKHVCGLDAGQPYWRYYREFSAYLDRICAFNSRGRTQAQVAVLDPATARFALTEITSDTSIRNETSPLPEHGDCAEAMLASLDALVRSHRDFELLFEDVAAAGTVSEDGVLNVPESGFRAVILPQCYILGAAAYEKLARFAEKGGMLVAVGDVPAFAMAPGGNGMMPVSLPVRTLDPYSPDFAGQLAAALEGTVPREYRVSGAGTEGVLARFCGEDGSGWRSLFLANGTPGRKVLTLTGPAARTFRSVTDMQSGRVFRYDAPSPFTLEDGDSLLFSTDPAEDAPRFAAARGKSVPLPADGWRTAAPVRNSVLTGLEVLRGGTFVPLADNGAAGFVLDPEVTPEVKLRGTFRAAGQVPEDLRVWLDFAGFRDFAVNGHPVCEVRHETVIDPQNTVVPIAQYCRAGENTVTVTVTLSPWMRERCGIRRHFGNLMRGCGPLVLLGSFRVCGGRTVAPISGTLSVGDLSTQGFPQFADELTLWRTFLWDSGTPVRGIAVGESLLPVSLSLNGQELGCRLWKNGGFEIPGGLLRRGENTLAVRLCGDVWNLLQRRWVGSPVSPVPFVLPEVRLVF